MTDSKPSCILPSPALLDLYEIKDSIVVVIDVLRATSTIATALYNGAASVIPVDDIARCITISNAIGGITAGERDGKVAEGLQYGNSPFEYPREFIQGKTLVLTTTNGTKLLHMAVARGASHIITGSFVNFTVTAVCNYLVSHNKPVILGCAAWKDRVNIEDTLFAGAVIHHIGHHFRIECDASNIAETLYTSAEGDLYGFLKKKNATHYHRLTNYGLEKDLRYCITKDSAAIVPFYENERLTAGKLSVSREHSPAATDQAVK